MREKDRRRQIDKRNARVRRRRAERAAESPEEAAARRAKDAELKRFRRSSLSRPNGARALSDRVSKQVGAIAKYVRDKQQDFTISRCFNPTTLKWTTFLQFSDLSKLLCPASMMGDSIIDWHCSAVAEGLGIDRSKIRLLATSTTNLMFAGANNDRIRYDHLSKKERRVTEPKSILEFSKLIYPLCIRKHWVVVAIEPREKTIKVYDSLQNSPCRIKEIQFRFDEYIADQSDGKEVFKTIQVNVPQQSNSIDCGVFVADRVACLLGANDGKPICVDEDGVMEYRARMYWAATECMHMHTRL